MSKLVTIVNRVANSRIRKAKNARGDDIYIIPSFTLPDNIVMNGGLYPAEEIEKAYHTLEGKPAPIGHPYDADGNYVSANSEDGLNYFYAGVTNKAVSREEHPEYGHRVYVEKHVNIAVARKHPEGHRLINAIERGDPIDTSTGVILEPVVTDQPMTNEQGKEYTWIATDMVFDHDAILLDEDGAAGPEDGVGMLVNKKLLHEVQYGDRKMAVNTVRIENSVRDQESALSQAVQREYGEENDFVFVQDFTDDVVIFERSGTSYQVGYREQDGSVDFIGPTQEVRQQTKWEPVRNAVNRIRKFFNQSPEEGNDMKMRERVESALKAAEIDYSEMDDEAMMNEYDKLNKSRASNSEEEPKTPAKKDGKTTAANQETNDQEKPLTRADVAEIAANAASQALATRANADEAKQKEALAKSINRVNSTFTVEELQEMPLGTLQKMEANTKRAHGFGPAPTVNSEFEGCSDALKLPSVEA